VLAILLLAACAGTAVALLHPPGVGPRLAPVAAGDGSGASVTEAHIPSGVVVYTTSWCGWCRKTLAHLDGRGISYENRDIEADPGAADDLRRKTGRTAVPVIEIDGTLIQGFDAARIDALLSR
jgi:glutaredoxin-like YruB-family protein